MKKTKFPVFETKIKGVSQTFDLTDIKEREKYFQAKAGEEIKKLKNYLVDNTFIAYLLAKKNAGKGTYTRLFIEIFGEERAAHISIGDIVRTVHQEMGDEKKKKELFEFLKRNYRGYISVEEAIKALLSRDTKSLLPTEFILALVKREIDRMERKALFVDGFPRDLDQVSYSLFFRDLIDYREDPDFFILIDVPEAVIDERLKNRVVCPICQTPRNLKTLATKSVGYDQKTKQFFLRCDNPKCKGKRMLAKEGDELGIEAVRDRLTLDERLMKQAFSLHGVGKVLLRNAVPVKLKDRYVDDYEITPEYSYKWDSKTKKVKVIEKPWIVKDDEGVPSYSLLAPPVVVSMIKQIVEVLDL